MAKDLAIITVHGMGKTKRDYHQDFEGKLSQAVGRNTWDSRVHLESVYYQDLMQGHEERYLDASNAKYNLKFDSLREFMVYSFSDAASIEHDKKLYKEIPQRIPTALDKSFEVLGNEAKPVLIIAHSLGAQQVSNYIWDVIKDEGVVSTPSSGTAQEDFRRLSKLLQLITIGCNIPLFKAGTEKPEIFVRPNIDFTWHNYFDAHDVLGYPIKTLAPSFDVNWISNIEVKVGGGFSGRPPLSHLQYWTDKDIIRPMARDIKAFLP